MIFRRLVRYVQPHWRVFLFAFILLFIATMIEIGLPLGISYYIDHFLLPKHWIIREVLLFCAIYFGCQVLSALLLYKQEIRFQKIAQSIIRRMRIEVFSKVQQLSLAYFDRTPTGSMITRITNDTESIRDLYVSVLASLLQNSIFIIGVLVGLFILDPGWALTSLVLFPLFYMLIATYRKVSRPIFQKMRSKLSQLNTHLNETLQGMSVIQVFSQEARLYEQFRGLNQDHFQLRIKGIQADALLLRPATDFLWILVLIVILQFFGWQAIHAEIKIGVLYGFINLINRVFEPLQQIVTQLPRYQESIVSAERVFQLLDQQDLAPQQLGNDKISIDKGLVEFRNVSFAYSNGELVLDEVSFCIEPGQTVGLVGHTGSGKSTIVQLLLRFYEPTSGEILLEGKPLARFSEQELRTKIGLVLQDSVLFHGSVRSNIGLDHPSITDQQIINAAQLVQADPFIRRLPNGYDQIITDGGTTLSSGEKQLLAFARTMALMPKILVLDEATAHIDTETEELIQQAMIKMRKDRTTFIIAHRLSTIRDADQILVLDRGRIVERGTHKTLVNQGGIYAQMDQMQNGIVVG
ncbi:ATP-binding cassette, subfamily B [Seinonella peptonophila]|uniref:ATP-binding cassette, subfamily B n=1 Tax=Seinonella peptonophila TaxID=112248 RepID=A0A1M4TQC7_9BACL|nr:ABC transporter ATP-binding protein [Seinonella peptonophila]SHE46596.1 ATP-binding cassette, subfamily B [Seinonella peptonophila]